MHRTGPCSWLLLAGLLLTCLFPAGCYRLRSPPALGEPIRLVVAGNDSRLVRQQAYLTENLGRALADEFGWRVSEAGTATLQIALRTESIESVARDDRDTPTGWRVRITADILLTNRQGNLMGTVSGTGTYIDKGSESEALDAAATAAGQDLLTWLDGAARRLEPPAH